MGFIFGFFGIIFGILFLIVLCYIFLIIKLRALGFKGFNIFKIKQEIEDNLDSKPKQVSGMTSLLLPQITKRFKDFNLSQMFLLTEKSIRTILNSIETKNISTLEDKDFNLINKKLKLQLEDLISSDILYKYDDIVFHKHALKSYSYSDGIATLEISSSLEYYFDKIKDGKSVSRKKGKVQARYITKYVFINDSDAYENDINVYGLNCPNCGAVISSLNSKRCKYCKTGLNIQVVELLKCWKLIDIKENN